MGSSFFFPRCNNSLGDISFCSSVAIIFAYSPRDADVLYTNNTHSLQKYIHNTHCRFLMYILCHRVFLFSQGCSIHLLVCVSARLCILQTHNFYISFAHLHCIYITNSKQTSPTLRIYTGVGFSARLLSRNQRRKKKGNNNTHTHTQKKSTLFLVLACIYKLYKYVQLYIYGGQKKRDIMFENVLSYILCRLSWEIGNKRD